MSCRNSQVSAPRADSKAMFRRDLFSLKTWQSWTHILSYESLFLERRGTHESTHPREYKRQTTPESNLVNQWILTEITSRYGWRLSYRSRNGAASPKNPAQHRWHSWKLHPWSSLHIFVSSSISLRNLLSLSRQLGWSVSHPGIISECVTFSLLFLIPLNLFSIAGAYLVTCVDMCM